MKRLALPLILALATASLVSCAPASDSTKPLSIVASTNVYGSIAEAIAGKHATVMSIIDNPAQDPHSFEAGARVQLELSRADVIISNGGGYDDFMDTLLAGSVNTSADVIVAVQASGLTKAQIATNEHVWYDLDAAKAIAVTLGDALMRRDPVHASDYEANLQQFTASVSTLEERVAAIAHGHSGRTVMVTEPVPLYLLEAAGLVNLTPTELSTAIENGNGVPPAVLNAALKLLASGKISLFVFNAQTSGPETEQLRAAAIQHTIPVIPVTETLPDGLSYLSWMAANIKAVEEALK